MPTPQPAAQAIERINGTLQSVQQTVNGLQNAIAASIQFRLSQAGISLSACQAAVDAAIQAQLAAVNQACNGSQECIERQVAALTSAAWETAAQAGCIRMPDHEPPTIPTSDGIEPACNVVPGRIEGPSPYDHLGQPRDNSVYTEWAGMYSKVATMLRDLTHECSLDPTCIATSNLVNQLHYLCPQLSKLSFQVWGVPSKCILPVLDCDQSRLTLAGGNGNDVYQPTVVGSGGNGSGLYPTLDHAVSPLSSGGMDPFLPPPSPHLPPPPPPGDKLGVLKPGCPPLAISPPPGNSGAWFFPNPGSCAGYPDPCGCVPKIPVTLANGATFIPVLGQCAPGGNGWLGTMTIGGFSAQVFAPDPAITPFVIQSIAQAQCGPILPPPPPPPPPNPSPTLPPTCGPVCPPACPQCPTCKQSPCGCPPKPANSNKFCAWKDADGNCYITQPGEAPHNTGDVLLGCDVSPGGIQPLIDDCKKKKQAPNAPGPGFVNAPAGGMFCSLAVADILPSFEFQPEFDDSTAAGIVNDLLIGGTTPKAEADEAYNALPFPINWFVWVTSYVGFTVIALGGAVLRNSLLAEGCANVNAVAIKVWLTLLGFLGQWVSPIFAKVGITANYVDSWNCPQQIPSTADAQAAYLANAIDETLRDTWTAANNDCPEPAFAVLQARRAKLSPLDIISLYRRGLITEDDYNEKIRELGYIRTDDADNLYTLSNQIPPVSELIRMMVRDVADIALVNKFGLDNDFTNKWTGQLKDWGFQQGITDDFAKYEWRAHWSIPSPGQLYEFYHRYRKQGPAGSPPVDLQTVTDALKQQDILPYWIPYFVDASFRLPTRSDLIQMLYYGTLDSTTVKPYLSRIGYSDADVDLYAKYLKRRRSLRARTHPYVRSYVQGNIPQDTLRTMLTIDAYEQSDIDDVVTYADVLRKAKTATVCRASVKRKFMLGEITFNQVGPELIGYGYDVSEASDFANAWLCERSAKVKQIAAEKLCKWFASGIIDASDFSFRLTNIGYKPIDVINIMTACQQGIDAKAAAAAAKKLAQQEKDAEKLAKEQAQAAKQAASAAQKAAKQVAAMQKAANTRQKAMVHAAELWVKGCGGTVSDAMDAITTAVAWIRNNTTLTYDEAISATIQAASSYADLKDCSWDKVYQDVAAAWQTARNDYSGPEDTITAKSVAV